MNDISRLRCLNHAKREAVALCTRCSNSFCRECIVEYEERIVCGRCLAALEQAPLEKRARLALLLEGVWGALSFVFLWAVYYYFGRILLSRPSTFHESIFGRMLQ
jgi:hypothetical protein